MHSNKELQAARNHLFSYYLHTKLDAGVFVPVFLLLVGNVLLDAVLDAG